MRGSYTRNRNRNRNRNNVVHKAQTSCKGEGGVFGQRDFSDSTQRDSSTCPRPRQLLTSGSTTTPSQIAPVATHPLVFSTARCSEVQPCRSDVAVPSITAGGVARCFATDAPKTRLNWLRRMVMAKKRCEFASPATRFRPADAKVPRAPLCPEPPCARAPLCPSPLVPEPPQQLC